MSILEVHNIIKTFGPTRAVDGVSLTVHQGDSLSIVGESGCGKTTLAKIMLGLIKPDAGQITVAPHSLQMVFQDPYNSLDPLWQVRSILKEAFCHQKGLGTHEQEELMAKMLAAVGLGREVLNRFPHEFSGGERQRIAIARALLANPKVLILDEAVSALDTLVQKQIIRLLMKLKQELNLTYIFISHNLRIVRNFSDKIIVMHEGKIVEAGSQNNIFQKPCHPYTKQLLAAAFEYKVAP